MTHSLAKTIGGLLVAAVAGVGCAPPAGPEALRKELIEARREINRLEKVNKSLRSLAAERQEQVEKLQMLGPKRMEMLFHVERIELGRYTGGVDRDGRPGDDSIRIFLRPIDQDGSVLKAAGEATVELYDLAAAPGEKLVGKRSWSVGELRKQWASGFISYHYSLECPWAAGPPAHDEITVRVTFVDYLTGKTFTAQKLCKIELPGEDG